MISYIYKQDRYVRTVRTDRFVLCCQRVDTRTYGRGARRVLRERAATPMLAAQRERASGIFMRGVARAREGVTAQYTV